MDYSKKAFPDFDPVIDANQNHLISITRPSDYLFIGFAGVKQKFEFVKTVERFNASGVFLRDPYNHWYMTNIPGVGNSYDEISQKINKQINNIPHKKKIAIGFSMGGFGALLYAPKLNVDAVLIFSPQTNIPKHVISKIKHKTDWTSYNDVAAHYKKHNMRIPMHIHYCNCKDPSEIWEDKLEANRLMPSPHISIIEHPCTGHGVAYMMKANNTLDSAFDNIINAL